VEPAYWVVDGAGMEGHHIVDVEVGADRAGVLGSDQQEADGIV
jgi:hypothetical protein